MLIRCDEDGKLYLYDLVRTKKKRASRLSIKPYGGKLRFFLFLNNIGKSVVCQENNKKLFRRADPQISATLSSQCELTNF
jgi:hypothetical protein